MSWAEDSQALESVFADRFGDGPATLTTGANVDVPWPGGVTVEDVGEADVPVSLAASVSARIVFPRADAPATPATGQKLTITRYGTSRSFRLVKLEKDEAGGWVFFAGGGR